MSENYQTVLNHLLFHKALISETEGGQRINRYLAMLNEIDQGMHVAVREPFEKSVVAAIELAPERQIDGRATPLTEAIRREGRRAVTLMELMDAFDEARREADLQLQRNALREAAIRKFAPNFHQKVHGEDLTEDIALTWQRLAQFNGEPIPLRQLTVGDVWDEVTVFMSLLFLAHLEKVKLWQKDYPYGEIFVKRLSMEADLPTEELLAIPALGPKPPAPTPEAVP